MTQFNRDYVTHATVNAGREILRSMMRAKAEKCDAGSLKNLARLAARVNNAPNACRATTPLALAYMSAFPQQFSVSRYTDTRSVSGDSFNMYAIPKDWEICTAFAGGTLMNGIKENFDAETLIGTLLAIKAQRFPLSNALNDYMNKERGRNGTYTAGSTQSSSACRALEAHGIIGGTRGKRDSWHVVDAVKAQRLIDAFNGIYADFPNMPENVDSSALEGVYEVVPTVPTLALPMPARGEIYAGETLSDEQIDALSVIDDASDDSDVSRFIPGMPLMLTHDKAKRATRRAKTLAHKASD